MSRTKNNSGTCHILKDFLYIVGSFVFPYKKDGEKNPIKYGVAPFGGFGYCM